MFRSVVFVFVLMFTGHLMSAQRYLAKDGYVRFFSEAPLENIEAVNRKGMSLLDMSTGEVVFTIPIKQFVFDKSLMQKHFNENYLESDKYPDAIFKGKINGFSGDDGAHDLVAEGEMTIHGVSRDIKVKGTGKRAGEEILITSTFPVALEDYDIDIPRVVMYNIAEEVEVNLEFKYEPYEKQD